MMPGDFRPPNIMNINNKRVRLLNKENFGEGPVVYWMSRDQRVNDNWALLHALALASERKRKVMVVFALTGEFPGAYLRHYDFMLRGLMEVEKRLCEKNIDFRLLTGRPPETLGQFLAQIRAGALVGDFDPLRIKKLWKKELLARISIPFYEVDAHNIIPCFHASGKQEFAAYTFRPKVRRQFDEFIEEFPGVQALPDKGRAVLATDWNKVMEWTSSNVDPGAGRLDQPLPGENAAGRMLEIFINENISRYHKERNDPNSGVVSNLSPYLHFGHISAQAVAIEILKKFPADPGAEAFLEELVVRRELSDNFCHYNPHYDSFEGFPDWAQKTLNLHRRDEREFIYTGEQFETARTHDPLWNAAQLEMVNTGKMHGYMRMYWAKKILEWSAAPEDALGTAIYLNDKYELDGRDPNGYTGCAWSIGGVHDRAWAGRQVYGKIRYMNERGAQRKFDTRRYIENNSLNPFRNS